MSARTVARVLVLESALEVVHPYVLHEVRRSRGHGHRAPLNRAVLHGVSVAPAATLALDLFAHVELAVAALLHEALEARHKGAVLDRLDGKVHKLVGDDLTVHHDEALDYLRKSALSVSAYWYCCPVGNQVQIQLIDKPWQN